MQPTPKYLASHRQQRLSSPPWGRGLRSFRSLLLCNCMMKPSSQVWIRPTKASWVSLHICKIDSNTREDRMSRQVAPWQKNLMPIPPSALTYSIWKNTQILSRMMNSPCPHSCLSKSRHKMTTLERGSLWLRSDQISLMNSMKWARRRAMCSGGK